MNKIRKYLALGDSYTIGEAVNESESFPYQLAGMLRLDGHLMEEVRVIAKTGWTTDELDAAIDEENQQRPIACDQDLVSLLIGVNNQFRGRSVSEFEEEFIALLQRTVRFAADRPERVRVLSIPDWGVTPYAEGRDRSQISEQIDGFNQKLESNCSHAGMRYIYITDLTREAVLHPELLTSDGLHPSGIDYKRWAERVRSSLKSS
ncbi:MAG: SGNH/GDSL hydrolase family protein [Bacteroidota bacterium]